MKGTHDNFAAKRDMTTVKKELYNERLVPPPAPITLMRRTGLFIKTTCLVVAIAFLGLYLQPLAMAARLPEREMLPPRAESNEERLARKLEQIETRLEKHHALLERRTARRAAELTATEDAELRAERDDLKRDREELDALDKQAIEEFNKVEKYLRDKKLPLVILGRHTEAVKQYKQEMATLKANLDGIEQAKDEDERRHRARKANEHLKAKLKRQTYTPADPKHLPFRVPDATKTRKPAENKEAFRTLGLLQEDRIQVAALDLAPGMLLSAAFLAAPGPADLQPTEDVQITPEIQALAAQLEHSPVKIYNWVHNNIGFVPTYGSIQGSQMCLETKQCNAFDTASLLIALFRASRIHARYAYGTVQIPAEKVMNWVGGVTKPEAAQQLLGQGGIPNAGLVQGGKITHIKLEHVWVEAWVDFFPSRGALHREGDTWVPMDASFKQYRYTEGMDIRGNVPFDSRAFIDQVRATATVNEAEGWATNFDSNYIQTTFTEYQDRVRSFISSDSPNATLEDIVGGKSIVPDNRTVLASSLPYTRLVTATRFSTIPQDLQHKFELSLYATTLDQSVGGPLVTFSRSLPELTGKKLTLAYSPATDADKQLVTDFLATSNDLPGYLINVRAELLLDGQRVAQSAPIALGQQLALTTALSRPGASQTPSEDLVSAGEVFAIDIFSGGHSKNGYLERRRVFAEIVSNVEQQGEAVVDRDTLLDNLLHSTLMSYFGLLEGSLVLAGKTSGVVRYQLPSYGRFGANFRVTSLFGIPRQVAPRSLLMDINRHEVLIETKDGNPQTRLAFGSVFGATTSMMEHLVPELVYSEPSSPSGISTVKLLSAANQQGMRVYGVDGSSAQRTLPLLGIDESARGDISNSVAAGITAVTHQNELTLLNWSGSGYVLFDPATGAGAYRLSGGARGGEETSALDVVTSLYAYLQDSKVVRIAAAGILLKVVQRIVPLLDLEASIYDLGQACTTQEAMMMGTLAWAFAMLIEHMVTWVAIFGPLGLTPVGAIIFMLFMYIIIEVIQNMLIDLLRITRCRPLP